MSRHHVRIFGLAATLLLRRRTRTLVIVAVYSALIGLVASLVIMVQALRQEARLVLADAPQLLIQRTVGGRHEPIPLDRLAEIRDFRGVISAEPRVWGYSYDPPTGAILTLWGLDAVPLGQLEMSWPRESPVELLPGECLVGHGISEARLLWEGDRLPLRSADGGVFAPRIKGIFSAESSILTNDLVVLNARDVRSTLGIAPDEATDFAIEVFQPQEIRTISRKIQERWPDTRSITREQILATYDAVFDWRGGLWAALLLTCAASFAVLVWDQATGLSAEDRHTIGLLKAVGWKPRDVLELRLWEGGLTSVLAMLTGIILAEVHVGVFDGALYTGLLRGWSVLFPSLEIHPTADSLALLLCLPLVVLPYVFASLLPAWRASIVDPDSILRS